MPYLANSVEVLERQGGPFQTLMELACDVFGVPAAVVSLLTDDEAVLRANADICARRIPRRGSLSERLATMGPGGLLVVEDWATDPRVADHPLMIENNALRFYAGVTLCGPDGRAIGALGLLDIKPRTGFGEAEVARLRRLATMVEEIVAGLDQTRRGDELLGTLKLVEEMSGVGHWRLDVRNQTLMWSDEVFRIHGVTRETFDPQLDSAVGFYHPDDIGALGAMIENSTRTGEGYRAQLRIIRADGRERQVLTQAGAERDETGQVVALFGVFQDVTEQYDLLASARRNESRYRMLAENVDDVITRLRPDGTSKYISPAIQSLLGWSQEEMCGQAFEYIHPDDRAAVQSAILGTVSTGRSTRLQHRALHRDGSIVWVECTFRAMREARTGQNEIIVVIRGIDDRKALETAVIEARDRAEAAAAAKSEFLANMSHELRTPLTSVVGFASLLSASPNLGATERGYIERIATASDALLAVINDILDYSKLEAGGVAMDSQPFSPARLVEGAVAIVEAQCQVKGLALHVEIDPTVPPALIGDEGRLRQVLLNFLSNAVKFTAQGGVTIKLGGVARPDGWRLRAEVTDTGIGIPNEKLGQLFERFSQADASTTRLYGGTGLGLAISRRLIDCMGGDLGVVSRPELGSTFWFEVDLAAASAGSTQASTASEVETISGRILVADDAPANRELINAILSGLGLQVDLVCDGGEAVQAVQTRDYDLVLMDVHMPVMDGLAATREIRRLQAGSGRRTPVLALTANVQADQVERCLEAGMDAHLAKPIQIPNLIVALSRWLSADEDMGAPSRMAVHAPLSAAS